MTLERDPPGRAAPEGTCRAIWGKSTVAGLEYDSRRVQPGFLFFAFPGARADGREFAQAGHRKGAVAVVSELPAPEGFLGAWIEVEHGRQALALAARNFYGKPDREAEA